MNRIERYDIALNNFEEIFIRLPQPIYGCVAAPVSENKIFIAGGWSEEKGNSAAAYTIDVTNGKIDYLKNLPVDGWTVLPTFYINGSFHIFYQGEETDRLPDHVTYTFPVPYN